MLSIKYAADQMDMKKSVLAFVSILFGIYLYLTLGHPITSNISSDSRNDGRRLTISCVGDSLTFGSGSTGTKQRNAYPSVLRRNPQFSGYKVHNFGEGGMCVLKSTGKFSYWNTTKFAAAMISRPDIVIIMLGTNDAKTLHWDPAAFRNDYIEMIRGFQNLKSKPVVYISIPPPIYSSTPIFKIDPQTVNNLLPIIIPEIALACNVTVINNFDVLGGVHQNFTRAYMIDESKKMLEYPNDGCHLSDFGYNLIAENVAKTLVADRQRNQDK